MLERIIYLDFVMLILDSVTICSLRRFLLDFLMIKRNRKSVKKAHTEQSIKNRITLNYIKPLLKQNISEFSLYHKVYIVVLATLVPQYIILIACNVILGLKSIYAIGFFAAIKLIICVVIRLNVDSNMVSIYRKK